MSAFLVSNETINRVLHLLMASDFGSPQAVDGDEMGRKLWKLNADAVACRYQEVPDNEPETFRWRPAAYTHFQMLKAAHCWMYQCNEGDQFTDSLTFSMVREKAQQLASHIVRSMPGYDKAEWDAPHDPRMVGRGKPQRSR